MKLDRVFAALASAPRRQILAYLSQAEQTTSGLATRLGLSAPAVSRHLLLLENAGLVRRRRAGQFVFYRADRESLVNVLTVYALEVGPVRQPSKRLAHAPRRRNEAG